MAVKTITALIAAAREESREIPRVIEELFLRLAHIVDERSTFPAEEPSQTPEHIDTPPAN
jgi:hypothetical protein